MSDVEYLGKATGKTRKEIVQERLLKAKVLPASKLAEAKKLDLQRSRDFEAAIEDEERHRRTASIAPKGKLNNAPLTRVRFEE